MTVPPPAARPAPRARGAQDQTVVLAAVVLAAVAGAAQALGLAPVVTTLVVCGAWWYVLSARCGVALGLAATLTGWLGLVFIAFTLTPLLGPDPRWFTTALTVVSLGGAWALVRRGPTASPREAKAFASRPLARLCAASVGGALWLVGLAWGLMARTGGLSWAMYRDSTMDLWEMRRMAVYGGVGTLGTMFNVQPLTHAVSLSLVDPRVSVAASPQQALAYLSGHAAHWSIVLVVGATLWALVAARITAGAAPSPARHRLSLVVATLVSMGLTSMAVAGVAMDVGQINAPFILALLGAAVVVGQEGHRHRGLQATLLLALLGLLLATWTLFAVVPAALLLPALWSWWRAAPSRDAFIGWILPGAVLCVWSFIPFGMPVVRALFTYGRGYGASIIATTTHANPGYWESYTNPYAWPLACVACLVACAGLALCVRADRAGAAAPLIAMVALVVGWVPVLVSAGGWTTTLAYYPAKYLWLVTIVAVVLGGAAAVSLAGGEPRRAGRTSGVARVLGLASVAALAVTLVTAPPPPLTASSRWQSAVPAGAVVARGAHFGTDAQVARRFIDNASSEVLRLPWRLDPPYDTHVALMMSSVGPDVEEIWLNPMRAVLRNERGNFGTDIACALARADARPLQLLTADPALAPQIAQECPAEDITVVLSGDGVVGGGHE